MQPFLYVSGFYYQPGKAKSDSSAAAHCRSNITVNRFERGVLQKAKVAGSITVVTRAALPQSRARINRRVNPAKREQIPYIAQPRVPRTPVDVKFIRVAFFFMRRCCKSHALAPATTGCGCEQQKKIRLHTLGAPSQCPLLHFTKQLPCAFVVHQQRKAPFCQKRVIVRIVAIQLWMLLRCAQ